MHSYDDMALLEEISVVPAELTEGWRGTDLVKWQSRLLTQMQDMIAKYTKLKNTEYVDKLSNVLKIWKDNPISGSVNVEDLKILQAATSQLASDDWKLQKYFRNIETNIRAIVASEEELPRMPDENAGPAKPTPRFGGVKEKPEDTGEPKGEAGGAPAPEAEAAGATQNEEQP